MGKAQIRITYQNAIRQAAALEETAEQMSVLQKELENVTQSLQGSWQGEGAKAYLAKCFRLQEKMKSSGESLQRTAAAIRRIAKIY